MTSADEHAVRVLFVDDEQEILLAVTQLLRNEQFVVLTAASGAEGLEILKNTEGIGVIVADRNMPVMSGIEFLSRAWNLSPDTLRIMLTCCDTLDVEHEALYRAGAFRFISKPWKNDELIKILRDAVATYTLIRENRRLTARLSPGNREKADRPREKTFFPTV